MLLKLWEIPMLDKSKMKKNDNNFITIVLVKVFDANYPKNLRTKLKE